MSKELKGPEEFERALAEEIQISNDFGLPLGAISLRLPDGRDAGLVRLLAQVRLADLVTEVSPEELTIVLPNTSAANTGLVEGRLRATAPGAAIGAASYGSGDTPRTLLDRARKSRAG